MKFNELSQQDQDLLATDLPEALEKQAAEKVAMAQDLYATGFSKLAEESAKEMDEAKDKADKEDADKPEKKLDDGEKKEAAARGAFIAKGYIDGLKKLGSDRHGDENHYFYPMVAEKLAAEGMDAEKIAAAMDHLRGFAGKLKGHAQAAGAKAKEHAGKAGEKAKAGFDKMKGHFKAHKGAYGAGAAGAAGGFAAGRASKKDD